MQIATNQEVLNALGLSDIKNMANCVIRLEHGKAPRAEITVYIEQPARVDWLSVINCGLRHSVVLKIVKELTEKA
jgi:hypothetical protein